MKDESQLLKTLLLKQELETLEELKNKFLSKEQFTQEVSAIVAKAVARSQKNNNQFNKVLAEPINDGVQKVFSKNKQTIIDSMLPIMGKLIRKTVSNSIKIFVTDINRTLELAFSAKALKWRWQAFRSGQSFAEIVFQKTIRYQIQEMFLIDRESGLLVEHAGKEDLMKNKDAISAMLTAIQDFIGDSLNLSESELLSAEIGDNLIWISSGPHAYLASVIRGNPTGRLKVKLQQLIEEIHADYSEELISQENFGNLPDVQDLMMQNLVTKSMTENEKTTNVWPWIIIPCLLFGYFGYKAYQHRQKIAEIKSISNSIPGFYLQSVSKSSEGYVIKALKDPLANLSPLESVENLSVESRSILSLDDEIISERINLNLEDKGEVLFDVEDGKVILKGGIEPNTLPVLKEKILAVDGVSQIINQAQINYQNSIQKLLEKHAHQDDVTFSIDDKILKISGKTSYDSLLALEKGVKTNLPELKINTEQLTVTDSTQALAKSVEEISIHIKQLNDEVAVAVASYDKLLTNLNKLAARNHLKGLAVIGQSDCFGNRSDQMSEKRANFFVTKLIDEGINKNLITTKVIECKSFTEPNNPELRVVNFKIKTGI